MLLVEVSSEEVVPIRQLWLGRLQYDGVDVMVVLERVVELFLFIYEKSII